MSVVEPIKRGERHRNRPRLTSVVLTWRRAIGLLVIAFALGAIARGFLPPFVLDDPFWRAFWSGPPAAGVFALLGAGVAYLAARVAAAAARRSARRQEWWDRAEWALTHAMAADSRSRDVGLAALEALMEEATTTEGAMINSVTSLILGSETDVVDASVVDDGE